MSEVIFLSRAEGCSVNRVAAAIDGRQGFKRPRREDYERVMRLVYMQGASQTPIRFCYECGTPADVRFPEASDENEGKRRGKRSDAGQHFGEAIS